MDGVYKRMQSEAPLGSRRPRIARAAPGTFKSTAGCLDFQHAGYLRNATFRAIADQRGAISGHAEIGVEGVFHVVRRMQVGIATLRVFAEPRLHELVVRYLTRTTCGNV